MNTKKSKLDYNSIKIKSPIYFMIFASILLLLIWTLQTFFINNYYEEMKISETRRTAEALESKYVASPKFFSASAIEESINSGLYIRVDNGTSTQIYDGGVLSNNSNASNDDNISSAKEKLLDSSLDTVSVIVKNDDTNSRTLVFASYIDGDSDNSDNAIMYIVAPLYPVRSTISIMRRQLMYITLISIAIGLLLALYLSKKLSTPIDNITKSAVELSKGNYNIKFNGKGFTETNELAKTLNKASYEMQKTDSYQRDLIANVSHDLKTPLTMIKSYAEMINDISGDNPEKRREHLQVIISETDRLNDMVTDMLAMSKIQSNSEILHKKNFNFVEAANSVTSTYMILNSTEGYDISYTAAKDTYVYGDIGKIKQVMSNLISNAIKYSGEDKVIKIVITKLPRKIRFDVIDNGAGIPSDELTHVWERYYRTSANHARNAEGAGLGLSIVKGILNLHNANYGVESKEGSGSDFWFEMEITKK